MISHHPLSPTVTLRPRARGYIGVLLMTGILAAAAVGMVANERYQAAARESWINRAADALVLQSSVATTAILGCGSAYTKGDNGDSASATDAKRFPKTESRLENVQCPGAPANAKFILKGRDGAFVSSLPAEFGAWSYSNSPAGLSFSVQANSALAAIATRNAMKRIGSNATLTGSTLSVKVTYPVLPPDSITDPTKPCGNPPNQPARPAEPEKQAQWYADYSAWERAFQAYQACLVWGPGSQPK